MLAAILVMQWLVM